MTTQHLTKQLDVCLCLLAKMGAPGQAVWELGKMYATRPKDPLPMQDRIAYLQKAISYLRGKASAPDKWRELPVDFRTFVESPVYLRKTGILWPRVMECGEELNSGRYTESVLTGAIGAAKSTLAIYTQAYQTYLLACMSSPQEVFDLDPSSEILIVFQSINKQVAKDVDYKRLRDMIANSFFFPDRFMFRKDLESDMQFPRNIIIRPVAGHDQAAIGQNAIGGILDEINFMAIVKDSKQTPDGSTYDQAAQNYNSIASRRNSRFLQLGELPGMLCLVSSRNYPGQFTDRKEEEAKTNPRIYVYDKRIWEIRPERYSGETFRVFIGDATRKPYIMVPKDTVGERDLKLVMDIPVEFRPMFENDLLSALREQAGVATQALYPFMMNTNAIAACFGKTQHVLTRTDCNFVSTRVTIQKSRISNPQYPRFAHIDLGITRDSAGVAIGHVPGFKQINRGEVTETLPIIVMDVSLEVKPPPAGEIEFSLIRKLLYVLRDLGLPIKWVSMDSMQSKDTMQILGSQGFIVGYQSLDSETLPYDVLRQAIYDGRWLCPEHALGQAELSRLEINQKTQKVDHPPLFSKDMADAYAGVTFGLTMRREIWTSHDISLRNIPKSLTDKLVNKVNREGLTYKENMGLDRSLARRAERVNEEARDGGSKILVR